ncbi:Uma2 family endonuclease [Methylolobus aquaticus]
METLRQRPACGFTYGDYRLWPEDRRWELIDGEAYDMSPAPTRTHQTLVGEVFRQIANYLDAKPCEVYVAPFDVRLPVGDETDDRINTVVQPDIAVICDPSKLDEAGCRGAPDWIIEVLSPATAAKDQVLKRDLYQRHGVREYWLVHPTDHILTRYRLENGGFGPALIEEMRGATVVDSMPGLEICWDFLTAKGAIGG